MSRILLSLFALAFAAGVQAQNFKWVDKDGKVRYGDTPPPGVKATPLKGPAAPPSAPADPAAKKDGKKDAKKDSPEEAFRKRQEAQKKDADKAAKAEKEEADRKQNCQSAQEALRNLESGQRIARTDAKGERFFVEDQQRAQETDRARQNVSQWCK